MAFINGKALQLFAAAVKSTTPFLDYSKSYFKNDIGKKKEGQTFYAYIPDSGTSTSGTNITGLDGSTNEKQVSLTARNRASRVDITVLNKVHDIESFADEIVGPRSSRLGADVQKEVVERVALQAEGVVVSTSAKFADLGAIAAKLRGVKSAGQFVGFYHPEIAASIIATGASSFQAPSTYAKESFENAVPGKFAGTEWFEIPEMPYYTMGTFVGTSGTTVGTTISADGVTSLVLNDATLTSASTVKKGTTFYVNGTKTIDLNLNTTNERYPFIVQADATATAGTVTVTINPVYMTSAAGASKNISGTIASGATVVGAGQVAGKTYGLIMVRDTDALEFDNYMFPEMEGGENETQTIGKIRICHAAQGNVLTRDCVHRFDIPYIADIIQPKLVRLAFVQVD
jgi:hypothetical protein